MHAFLSRNKANNCSPLSSCLLWSVYRSLKCTFEGMQRLFNITQFWRKVASSDPATSKETGESFSPTAGRLLEPSAASLLSILRDLLPSHEANAYISLLRQAVQRKYFRSGLSGANDATERATPDPYINERISMFLRIIRSSPDELHVLSCSQGKASSVSVDTLRSCPPSAPQKDSISMHQEVSPLAKEGDGAETKKNLVFDDLVKLRTKMLEAIEVCLQEIPPIKRKENIAEKKQETSMALPVTTSANGATVQSQEGSSNTPKGEHKGALREVGQPQSLAENGKASEEEGLGTSGNREGIHGEDERKTPCTTFESSSPPHPSVEHQEGAGTLVSSPFSGNTDVWDRSDRYEWRCLLVEISEVLLAIDATLYFEIFKRGKEQIMNIRTALYGIPSTTGDNITLDSPAESGGPRVQKAQTGAAAKRKKNSTSGVVLVRDGQGGSGVNCYPIEVYKTIDALLNTARSMATWAILRSVLQHKLEVLKKSIEGYGESTEKKDGPPPLGAAAAGNATKPDALHSLPGTASTGSSAPLINWGNVVADLQKIFQEEHQHMVPCVLCAAFLRDDGKELICSLIQEPMPKKVFQEAHSFTHSTKLWEDLSCGSPLATKAGDGHHSLSSHVSIGSSSASTGRSSSLSSTTNSNTSKTTAHMSTGTGFIRSSGLYGASPFTSFPLGGPMSLEDQTKKKVIHPGPSPSMGTGTNRSSGTPSGTSTASPTNVGGSGGTISSSSNTSSNLMGSSCVGTVSPTRKGSFILNTTAIASSASQTAELTDLLVGTSLDDLNEEIKTNYQEYIAKSWSKYLESVLPSFEAGNMKLADEKKKSTENNNIGVESVAKHDTGKKAEGEQTGESFLPEESRTFCQLATAYFFCSDAWSVEHRRVVFDLLGEEKVRKYAEERRLIVGRSFMHSPEALESLPTADGASQVASSVDSARMRAGDGVEGALHHHVSSTFSDVRAGREVLKEMEIRILNMAWIAALHKKVEQCIAARPPTLPLAEAYCNREWTATELFNDFRVKQRARTSFINYYLAAGNAREARQCALLHFQKEKIEWIQSNQTVFSAVDYLQSMVQLVKALAACHEHEAVIENVQMAIQQANFCDARLSELAPFPREDFILRFSEIRAKVLRGRLEYLRERWRANVYLRTGKEIIHFNEYLSVLRQLRSRYRETAIFDAQMDRGHQLMQQKEYKEAAEHFLHAVQLAKNQPGVLSFSTTSRAASDAETSAHSRAKSSFHRNIHLQMAGSGSLTTEEENINSEQKENQVLECLWRLAESERLLALAYVSQAENEVFVPQRRLELNDAVKYAYAAQKTLQKWQGKGGTPKRMLTAVPSILIVIAKALLLLNQPKKAMLLLEPLIEDKSSYASTRPPMWKEVLLPTPEPLTAEDIVLRMDVNSVTIDVYQLYAQCIVQFDEKKALSAVELVRHLLMEGDQWIQRVEQLILLSNPEEDTNEVGGTPPGVRPRECGSEHAFPHPPPHPLPGGAETCPGEELTQSVEDAMQRTQHQSSFSTHPSSTANQERDSIRVVLKSRSERSRALKAILQGNLDICRALRDIQIIKGDAFCKLKQWVNALHTFKRLVCLMSISIGRWKYSQEQPSVSPPYRPSAGPPTESHIEKPFPPEESKEPSAAFLYTSAWSSLLYGEDEYGSTGKSIEDQQLNFDRNELGDRWDSMDGRDDLLNLMMEEARVDHRTAGNLIFSKLATIYQAIGQIDTSIRYHEIVLKYSNQINNRLLEYKSLLHLARLYTEKNASNGSQRYWEEVSALACEYGDKEVGRETMRNLITAQENSMQYISVIESSEELHSLACAAEGAEAAADIRFALEARAKAHLELGQFEECLEALEEREKVQESALEWNGRLYEMKSKALLNKGETTKGINVLLSYFQKANNQQKFDEVGNALSHLAAAFASCNDSIRAQRCYVESITAFSRLPKFTHAQKKSILASARWLVHHFYLSHQLVHLHPSYDEPSDNQQDMEEDECRSHLTRGKSELLLSAMPRENSGLEEIENRSGNLAVLLWEEERRGENSSLMGKVDAELEDRPMENQKAGSDGGLPLIEQDENLQEDPIGEEKDVCLGDRRLFTKATTSEDGGRNTPATQDVRQGSTPLQNLGLAALGNAGTLGNVSLCSRPAAEPPWHPEVDLALTGVDHRNEESHRVGLSADSTIGVLGATARMGEEKAKKKKKVNVKISTLSFRNALAVMEWCTQLLVQRTLHACLFSCPFAPSEAVDLALVSHPSSTFIFFFAEFYDTTGSYALIIRPARSSFFITEKAQVFDMPPALSQENYFRAGLSCEEISRKARIESLNKDLWDPVCKALKRSNSTLEEASCVFIVPDVSLYYIPFGCFTSSDCEGKNANQDKKGVEWKPLAARCPLVITPSLVHLVSRGMVRDGDYMQFLKGKQFFRYAVLDSPLKKKEMESKKGTTSLINRRMRRWKKTPRNKRSSSLRLDVFADEPLKALNSWTTVYGLNKAQVVEILRDRSTKMVLFESSSWSRDNVIESVGGAFSSEDIISNVPPFLEGKSPQYSCQHLVLAVVQDGGCRTCFEDQPGFPVQLCLHGHCARVLRVEEVNGDHMTALHRTMIVRYFANLEKVVRHRLRYPFALALQMTIKEALEKGLPIHWCGSITLLGAP